MGLIPIFIPQDKYLSKVLIHFGGICDLQNRVLKWRPLTELSLTPAQVDLIITHMLRRTEV